MLAFACVIGFSLATFGEEHHGRAALQLDDLGSGALGSVTPVPGSVASGVERCCFTDTLYVHTGGWTGPSGMKLEKNAAGEWTGALVAIMREIATHTGMALQFIEQQDCDNEIVVSSGFDTKLAMHCVLSTSKSVVPLAKFTTLWEGLQHGKDLVYQEVYVTTSLMETDSVGLLSVTRKADYGIWQVCAPFDDSLWIALFVTCLLVSLLMPSTLRDGTTHRPITGGGASGLGTPPEQRINMFYHAWILIFGGDDLEWTSNVSSKLLRVGWLFFVLISVSSYTANLASFFTAASYAIEGPQDMTALRAATACLADHSNNEAHLASHAADWGVGELMAGIITATMPDDFANTTLEQKQELWSLSHPDLISRCAEKVRQGDADMVLGNRIGLTSWLLDRNASGRCDNFTFAPSVVIHKGNPRQMFLALNRSVGFELFSNVQVTAPLLHFFMHEAHIENHTHLATCSVEPNLDY